MDKWILGTVFHRESCLSIGGFDANLFPISDWDFYLRYLRAFGGSLVDSECTAFRWAVNEAQRPDVILLYVSANYKYRREMIHSDDIKHKNLF